MIPTAPVRPARPTLSVCPSRHAPDEFVLLLECCYGSYVNLPNPTGVGMPLAHPVCHNPIERPEDRRHCDFCGGDYCTVHADRAAHECESLG